MQVVFVILICVNIPSYGQSFEGTLTYVSDIEISEKIAKMGMTKQKLFDKMKKEGTLSDTIKTSYKLGSYCTYLNNNQKSRSIYNGTTNKIYSLQDGESSDICTVIDAAIDLEFTMTGKAPTVEKLDTTIAVNGINCNVVRIKWKSGTYDYYFNSAKLNVTPSLFAKHTYDGWAVFLQFSNALPLKIVKTTKGLVTITLTLLAIKQEPIDEKLFSIPNLVSDETLNAVKTPNKEIMRIKK